MMLCGLDTVKMACNVVFIVISCVASALGQAFDPVAFTLQSPPSLTGALSSNYVLYNVEKLHHNKYFGPTSFCYLNGDIYTVTSERKVINIGKCVPEVLVDLSPPGCNSPASCGLLTSIRVSNDGQLLVLDAYRGLFEVNPTTGSVKQLYSSSTPVGGRRPKYLNGIVQTCSGVILMSDSSDKYVAVNEIYIILEGRTSGRLLALNPKTGRVTEVKKDSFVYPNGLELTEDGTGLLVAESGRARIARVNIMPGANPEVTIFSNNLPGCPTNIRRTPAGTYWVALSYIRHNGIYNFMDAYSDNPTARMRTIRTDSREKIKTYYPKYGMVVELDQNGTIIGSLHDPSGQMYNRVSEVSEFDGLLYVGAKDKAFAGRFVLPEDTSREISNITNKQLMRSRCQITEEEFQKFMDTNRDQTMASSKTPTTVNHVTTVSQTPKSQPTAVTETTTEVPTTTAQTTLPTLLGL